MILTLFAVPKPFEGHIGIIQRNAITSWTLLKPRPEIVLLGKDKGVAEICEELDLHHMPDIVCNEFGTPLLHDIFQKAEQAATHDLLCYVNADIILTHDFPESVHRVYTWRDNCCVIGGRVDTDVTEQIDFNCCNWESALRQRASTKGKYMLTGMDYFVFRKKTFHSMPAFAIGRTAFDNWLVWRAKRQGPLVDATTSILAIHQNHNGPSVWTELCNGPEASRNRKLAGTWRHSFTLADASHELRGGRIHGRVCSPFRNRCEVLASILNCRAKRFAKSVLSESAIGKLRRFVRSTEPRNTPGNS